MDTGAGKETRIKAVRDQCTVDVSCHPLNFSSLRPPPPPPPAKIFHTDPAGIVPPSVVNATIGKGAGSVADMADYMVKISREELNVAETMAKLEKLAMEHARANVQTALV